MRRSVLIRVVMIAMVVGAAGSPIAAVDTVTGVLVDSSCAMSLGMATATSAAHATCAAVCAQKGHRLAIVTSTGSVYMVTGALIQENNAKLIPMLNRTIVVTGTVATRVLDAVAPVPPLVPTLTSKIDTRRPTSNPDTIVLAAPKNADVREGEAQQGSEMTIEVLTVSLAKGAI